MTLQTFGVAILIGTITSNAFQNPQPSTHTSALNLKSSFAPDFYESYDDENSMHIPNRIGFTMDEWKGDEDPADVMSSVVESGISLLSCSDDSDKDLLGRALSKQECEVMVACSYNARFKFIGGESSILNAMEQSLQKLTSVSEAKLLQARASRFSSIRSNSIADGLLECIDEGFCEHGGVIDMPPRKLRSMVRKMEQRDEILVSNQFEYSLVNRKNEKWIERCKDLEVIPLIRNPLGKDLLASARWTSDDPLYQGKRAFSNKKLEQYEPLHSMQFSVLNKVQKRVAGASRLPELKDYKARRYEDKKRQTGKVTPAQIAINYVIAKGGVPLVDIYDEETANELIGCLGWKLNKDEVELLDQASELSEM
mmetsp:Transcript_1447/g.1944  ORF Transcript_1447/g.1944 Transcript_1447/m.1944 type:complete len:368 (-) Transcript_1447:48-1151(-)